MNTDEFRADLHCHTTRSDSTASPSWAPVLAAKLGVSALAITDHDTFSGIGDAEKAGEACGVTVVPGIELSSYDYERGHKVHILVYHCKDQKALEPIFSYTAAARNHVGEIMAQRLEARYNLPTSYFLGYRRGDMLFKQQLMHGLVDAGLAGAIFDENFHRLFGKGGSVTEPIRYLDVHKVLKAARESGGAVVLAHPAAYHSEELLGELIADHSIDGVEAFHQTATSEQMHSFEKAARENGLLVTGGTDFHGMYHKVPVPIGSFCVGRDDFLRLEEFCR